MTSINYRIALKSRAPAESRVLSMVEGSSTPCKPALPRGQLPMPISPSPIHLFGTANTWYNNIRLSLLLVSFIQHDSVSSPRTSPVPLMASKSRSASFRNAMKPFVVWEYPCLNRFCAVLARRRLEGNPRLVLSHASGRFFLPHAFLEHSS